MALKGKFVFSTQEVLKIAQEAERVTADKSARTRRRKRPATVELNEQQTEVFEDVSSNSDSDCIVVRRR